MTTLQLQKLNELAKAKSVQHRIIDTAFRGRKTAGKVCLDWGVLIGQSVIWSFNIAVKILKI